ncbi:MAG: glycosyltransferase family 2 protein [Coriobacteriales bacterium]|jgi:glycosyltransferase involved in cell wall biosynthesis|nr:glycosyltransferase family 2 protein [Coriobacteriales bacterium]
MSTNIAAAQKYITFAIPCYNVADYVDNCVHSILAGCAQYLSYIEIILVDDGSKNDSTPEIIDRWQAKHPDFIRAIHQENGGHGQAVNTGLANASGIYFKVVDADDWLDESACQQYLSSIVKHVQDVCTTDSEENKDCKSDQHERKLLDMIITNYVYEKVFEDKRTTIRYSSVMPVNKDFTWNELGRLRPYQNILMHSVTYRTQMLQDIGFCLPKHTFYVDNVFVYLPLPHVQGIRYLDLDLYRYFIGREGQSVNERVMVSRIEQQLRVTRIMIDAYDLDKDINCKRLRTYMESFITMMMVICSVFLLLSKRDDALALRSEIWAYLAKKNPTAYPRIRRSVMGRGVNLAGRGGEAITILGYRAARKIFKFS